MTHRPNQVATQLQRAVQAVLSRGLHDPRVRGLITVTAVTLSNDCQQATIGISVIPEDRAKLAMHGLHSATSHIRSEVASALQLRRMPQLTFRLDPSLKKQASVLAAINRANGYQRKCGFYCQ